MRAWLLTLAALAALATMLGLPNRTMAWGPKGHEIVGKIADKHLSKQARLEINLLLEGHQFKGLSDGKLTNWADTIKSSAAMKRKFPHMNEWHYIDVDVDANLQ